MKRWTNMRPIINAQKVRQNKEDCAELTLRVAGLVRDVCKQIRGNEHLVDEALKMSLEELKKYASFRLSLAYQPDYLQVYPLVEALNGCELSPRQTDKEHGPITVLFD